MRTRVRAAAMTLLLTALTATAFLAPAAAQEVEELPLRMVDVNSDDHPEVTLIVSVPRELVGVEIPPGSFTVTENGSVVDAEVETVPSDDLEVVLLLDVSGSMAGSPLSAAQSAGLSFIEGMPGTVKVAVVTIADTISVASAFSTDPDTTADALSSLAAGGETALYDGLVVAAEQFDPETSARRTVILLSDGGDTVSESTLERALVGLLNKEVSFYAIELQTPENDSQALLRLATATDGAVVAATDPAALEVIFEEIAAQLTSQYRLTYQSEAFGPTSVAVAVEVEGTTASTEETVRLPAAPPVVSAPVDTPAPEAAPEPAIPAIRPGSFVQLEFSEQPIAFYAAIIMVIAALFAALAGLGVFGEKTKSVIQKTERRDDIPQSGNPALSGLANRAIGLADRSLQGETGGRLNTRLEQAGISMRPAEFAVLAAIGAVVGAALGYLLFRIPGAVVGGILAFALVRLWVARKADQRKAAFAEQLPDTLHLMAGSLRAGFGLLQAIEVIAAESPSPTAEEFHRVKVEVHLGRDMDDALYSMAKRVDSEDFEWVTEGIHIHREVGGDIAEIIDSVNSTIRARNQIRRRIRSLSAEGRMSAVVLILLPIALAVIISLINPDYVGELTGSSAGRMMIAFAVVAMVVGVIWIKRIIRLEF